MSKILLACGGTGGHLAPGYRLGREFTESNTRNFTHC